MKLVSRLLERGRALLIKLSGSGHRALSANASDPHIPAQLAPCGVWGAVLAAARVRRAPQLWACPELSDAEADAITAVLIRAYVIPEDEQTRRLASPARRAW